LIGGKDNSYKYDLLLKFTLTKQVKAGYFHGHILGKTFVIFNSVKK